MANTDGEEEGVFKDFYTGQLVEYAPWPPDRPYAGGFRYNCMLLRVGTGVGEGGIIYHSSQVAMEDNGAERLPISKATIHDEECKVGLRAGGVF